MPTEADNLKRLDSPICESARLDNTFKWDDENLILKDAPVFGPAIDQKTGHFVSENGRHYARTFHDSVVQAINDGLIGVGYPYHPKQTARGGRETRPSKDSILKPVKGTARLDTSGSFPLVRTDLKFKNKSALEDAKFNAESAGISLFVHEPLGYDDKESGHEVVAMIDRKCSWKPTLDLVEAPSAAPMLAESLEDQPEKNTMTKEEIQALLDAQDAKHNEEMKKLTAGIAESQGLKTKLEGMEREQLVDQRLCEKKLAREYVTPGFRKLLTLCESVEAMDKEIDAQKAVFDKLSNPIAESHATQRVIVVGDRAMNLDKVADITSELSETGLRPVIESLVAGQSSKEARSRSFADKFPKSVLARIGNPKLRDADTRKLRTAVLEAWRPKETLEILSGRSLSTVEDVSEAVLESSSFSQTITGLLGAKVIDAYDITSEGFVSPQLMSVFQSALKTETWVGYTQPTGITSVAEAATYPDVTMSDKYVAHPALTKYGVRVRITREEVLWDQKQQVLMRANSVGEALAYDVEDRRIKALIDNATTTYYPAGAATALYSAGNGNLLTANPLTGSYLPIEAACNVLTAISDGNSRRLATNSRRPLSILVPQSLFMRAWYAVNPAGTQLRTGNSATVNDGGNPFAGTNVYVSNILDAIDATTWYISGAGGFQKQFGVKQNIPFEVVQLPQAEVQSVSADIVGGIRAAIMEAPFAFDYRYVVKCTAT